ncbi:MAG: DNA polymerase III beta subunit (EC [uncultured Campylobacterales bacterium]|uniref:Beta sliding clamp n=1 Tax=uncultured Campylobacterales bacterium TaxID=352960 RepID=A0A6S6S033_9BACT|nr:MAG: DNA polymerase III beta subunit (EC [uncultured Campylobacterales bacterium]
MKFSIQKNVLENILINIQPYLEKKDFSQITSHILIEAKENSIFINATDHEIGLSYEIKNIEIIEDGKTTTNGKKLLDIIKTLNSKEINLEKINESLYIKQNNSKFKLPVFNHNEFPKFPILENKNEFKIDTYKLIKSIKKITPSIDINNPKFELNGALINIKENKINFVSTDTKRLSIVEIQNNSEQEDISLIIPKKAINEIQKLIFDEITINYDNQILLIESNNFKFFTKLINGKFPEYQRIIPTNLKYKLELNKEKFLSAIKQISIISNEVKISFNKSNIKFESLNEDNIEAKTNIEANLEIDDDIAIALNSRFLIDFLNSIENNNFTLGYNDNNLPFTLQSEELLSIVMPLVI